MSWEQLREMRRSGLVEIGSHTYGLHTTVFTNPQGGETPAAIGHGFIRRRPGLRISERIPLEMPQPRFGDIRSILTLPFRPYLSLAIELAQAAIDYAYDPRTGRYETDEEYRRRVRADLDRNSDLLAAQLGVRPRVITWPYGRWNEVTVAAAREAGMPISLTLDPERASIRELGRIGRFYAAENPSLRFVSDALAHPPEPALLRGLCVHLDEVFAPSEEEQDVRLGQILDRILAFRPNMVLLAAASSAPGGGVYFPTDRLPVRADLFSRAAWQIHRRTGTEVYAWLPAEQAGRDPDTILAVHTALSRTVPFHGVGLGPISLATELPPGGLAPGISRWDPRTPRWVREGQDRSAPVRGGPVRPARGRVRGPLPACGQGARRRGPRAAAAPHRHGRGCGRLRGASLGRAAGGGHPEARGTSAGSRETTGAGWCTSAHGACRRSGGASSAPVS